MKYLSEATKNKIQAYKKAQELWENEVLSKHEQYSDDFVQWVQEQVDSFDKKIRLWEGK